MSEAREIAPRPRIVTAAFWCWLVGAVLLIVLGLLVATTAAPVPALFRGAGIIFATAALALSYLAGQARRGSVRCRRAALGLAFALAGLLAVFILLAQGLLWALPMVLIMTGAVLIMRPTAQEWFDGIWEGRA